MTCNINILYNVHEMLPIQVELPNGVSTLAVKQQTIYLRSKLVLKDVLYVPKLNHCLISIGQLIKDFCCIVTFMRRPIGLSEPGREV